MFSELAKNDLKRLREQGYSISDDEVVALNDLAVQIEAGKDTTAVNHPRFAFAGNVVLHEPTIGALEWWWSYGHDAAWTAKGKLNTYYFMLAHSRNVDVLRPLMQPSDINKAVKAWMKGVAATDAELFRALLYVKHVNDLIQQPDKDDIDDDRSLDRLHKLVIMCSGQLNVDPDCLKCKTETQLMQLIQASAKAGVALKPSIATLYIKYQSLIRQIENRGTENV